MKSRQTLFFANRSDLEPIVKRLEEISVLHYFEMGLFDKNDIRHYNSILEISNLGFVTKGDWIHNAHILIMHGEKFQ
jgi:hypothetical protein